MRQTSLPHYLKKGIYLSFRWFPKSPRILKQTQHNIIQQQRAQGKTQDEKDHHMTARTSLEAETKSWALCLRCLKLKAKAVSETRSNIYAKRPSEEHSGISIIPGRPKNMGKGMGAGFKWSHKGEGCPCQKDAMIKPPKTIRMSVLSTKLAMTQNTGQTWKEEPNCSPVNFVNKSWLTSRLTDHSLLQ